MGLDPAKQDSYDQFARCSEEHKVDVLVNNAGYAFIGGVEDTRLETPQRLYQAPSCLLVNVRSETEVRDQMEVNFYGPLRTVRACLPVMRARGSGHIILISSGAGYVYFPYIFSAFD